MAKKPTDLIKGKDTDLSEDDGGSGEIDINETTYSKFAREHGLDFSDMTLEEIQEIIHQYSQHGKSKSRKKVVGLDGKPLKDQRARVTKSAEGRTYQVVEESDRPVSGQDFEKAKAEESYVDEPKKQSKPENEPFNKPRGPSV